MKYFGFPKCPYCKKRINLIRVWRLKKHGEYICPRCKGISNVYHSPLIYALALLSCAAGFLIYFFEKYITDTVNFTTVFKVFIPFAVFYVFSLFMVYLEKPVIRKVFKRSDGKMVDENGKVVSIGVNTILSSGGKKVKSNIKNPANAEVRDLRNDPSKFRDNSEMIRRPKGVSPDLPKEKVSEPDINIENRTSEKINETLKNGREETKYTDEELKALEKKSDSGVRDNGTKTIRSRYRNESQFDEIFDGTQEISDKRLRSAKAKSYDIATPSIPSQPKKSEVKVSGSQTTDTEKNEAPKRFREL